MKRKITKTRSKATMDLIPLIDVVFLLLIFFIVASEFKKHETALKLNLPTASIEQKNIDKKSINIEVSKDDFALNYKKITFEKMRQALKGFKKNSNLNIRIDKDVKYQRIVKLLDILQELGLVNISLVTKK